MPWFVLRIGSRVPGLILMHRTTYDTRAAAMAAAFDDSSLKRTDEPVDPTIGPVVIQARDDDELMRNFGKLTRFGESPVSGPEAHVWPRPRGSRRTAGE
jgi:hypothetical protein